VPTAPDAKLVLLDGRRERRDGAEADEDGPREVALDERETSTPAQPLAERPGDEGPRAVADEAERREQEPEKQDLHPDRPARRVDELRQEREEEERRLRVQHVDDDPLAVQAAVAAR